MQTIDRIQFEDLTTDFLLCENNIDSINFIWFLRTPKDEIVYDWSIGETTESITISEAGIYSVEGSTLQVISGQKLVCSEFKELTALVSNAYEKSYTQTGFAGINSQLIINAGGSGNYEYALNDSGFVDSNILDVENTENTLLVRDKNGCGQVPINFIVLKIPDFFTSNGDGSNDYLQIEGIRQSENDVKTIYIFDRYGKLIFEGLP